MADLTAKKLNQASRLVAQIDTFMAALYDAKQIVDEMASAGLDYVDADFEATALAHLTAANMASARTNVAALVAGIEAAFQDDVFNAVRP
jgi:hypothetical protein